MEREKDSLEKEFSDFRWIEKSPNSLEKFLISGKGQKNRRENFLNLGVRIS